MKKILIGLGLLGAVVVFYALSKDKDEEETGTGTGDGKTNYPESDPADTEIDWEQQQTEEETEQETAEGDNLTTDDASYGNQLDVDSSTKWDDPWQSNEPAFQNTYLEVRNNRADDLGW